MPVSFWIHISEDWLNSLEPFSVDKKVGIFLSSEKGHNKCPIRTAKQTNEKQLQWDKEENLIFHKTMCGGKPQNDFCKINEMGELHC